MFTLFGYILISLDSHISNKNTYKSRTGLVGELGVDVPWLAAEVISGGSDNVHTRYTV